jgi:tRNA G26 N,N-dimethylase Trm1
MCNGLTFMRANSIYYLVDSFLQFTAGGHICFTDKGTLGTQHHQRCEYNYLKSMHMTGYKGAMGQLELLLRVVENAPVLEALTVETTLRLDEDHYTHMFCRKKRCSERAILHAKSCLPAKISPNVKLCVM